MHPLNRKRWLAATVIAAFVANVGAIRAAPAAFASGPVVKAPPVATDPSPLKGPPGYAMAEPIRGAPGPVRSGAQLTTPINETFAHTPIADSSKDLNAGSGNIMPSATVYLDFWLGTGKDTGGTTVSNTYEGTGPGNTNYENLITRFITDLAAGTSQYHNLVTQYSGNNGTVGDSVSFGGSTVDTTNAYPHAGTTGDPLQDADIQAEVTRAVAANGWSEDLSHIVAVFTATGIQECDASGTNCTFQGSQQFCAYHSHYSDGGTDTLYAFMGYDNFTHVSGKTCVAGQTTSDTDPKRGIFPNGDQAADAEVNTLSHELIEAETDPHPNDTWTGPNGEIGDACNFNFAPRNDSGADVYINGNPYILQQEYSNAVHTCAIDLATNGFCGNTGGVCAPTTSFGKSVDNPNPEVTRSINYTLTLNNTNNTGAETNLSVSDTVPSGYAITNVSAPSSTSSSNSSTSLTVGYDTLPVHQSRTITVTATVPIEAGTTRTNCGGLSGSDLLGAALSPQTTNPCASTTPVKIPTTLTYTGPTSGDFNDPVTPSAQLLDDLSNPVSGKTITFTLNGTESCSGVTDGSGIATCSSPITPGEAAAGYPLAVAFSDGSDPEYATSSATPTFTVKLEESKLTDTSPALTVHYHDPITVSAQLTDPDGGAAIAGKTVTFTLGPDQCTSNPSDASGNVSCTITPSQTTATTLTETFAGDAYYLGSSASPGFSTTPEEDQLAYTGPTVILAGASGATLTATMLEEDSSNADGDSGPVAPFPQQTVKLWVGTQSCTGLTDLATGKVTCTIPSITVPLGPETVKATFDGNAEYQAASDSKTATVFAFPSRGAFVLGDKTVAAATSATNVTWWADNWWQLDSLTGGVAPSAFKGFAGTITLPTMSPANVCSGNWTTTGGDSPPPTSGVPSYMGVVVTSKVTKPGTTVMGNYSKIVVVKVNPGYAPNPFSHGTGKIVATFCP
jgi:uncharacterized repeat protein (TIGR01451 family)